MPMILEILLGVGYLLASCAILSLAAERILIPPRNRSKRRPPEPRL